MKILKNILQESASYYKGIKKEILRRLVALPKGSIKRRWINKQLYYYLQYRKGAKVVHRYLGKNPPSTILKQLKERKQLEKELKKIKPSEKLLTKIKKG